MSTYENDEIGKIVIIKNIIFDNKKRKKKEIDHAWLNGRPCIIIYSDENYDYLLPIKSSHNIEKYNRQHFILTEKNLMYRQIVRLNKFKSNTTTQGGINLQNIYRIPISGHDEVNKVTFETYKEIIEKLKEYHQKENIDDIIKESQTMRGR